MSAHTIVELTQSIKTYTDSGDSAQEALTRASVGWTGKNKAFSQENNAVIAHIENGKSYKVSWVGSATVTLKKDTSSGTQVATGDTSPLSFTADSDFDLYFGSSADVTEIMVYDARIKDSTFEPYHESVDVCKFDRAEQAVLGAKNLAILTTVPSTYTQGKTTLVINSDMTCVADKSETDTEARYFAVMNAPMEKGTYAINGCFGGSASTYEIILRVRNAANTADESSAYCRDNEDALFTVPEDGRVVRIYIAIYKTAILTNQVFKPMIRLASDPDNRFAPPTITNRAITVRLTPIFVKSTEDLDNITDIGTYYWNGAHPLNTPEDKNYSDLQIIANGTVKRQIMYHAGQWIYMREHNGSAWGSWYKFTGTVVS